MVINMKITERIVKFRKAWTLQLKTFNPYEKEVIAYIYKIDKQGATKYFICC